MRGLTKAYSFDTWATGFQVGTYSDSARTDGFLVNFEGQTQNIKFYKLENGQPTLVFTK